MWMEISTIKNREGKSVEKKNKLSGEIPPRKKLYLFEELFHTDLFSNDLREFSY